MKKSKLDEAREIANELLDDFETKNSPIDLLLMKTKRLARMMRDTDAQEWLDYEIKGYPIDFNFSKIGTCKKYAISGGRLTDEKYYTFSLPNIEATSKTSEHVFKTKAISNSSLKAKDFLEQRATETLITNQQKVQDAQKNKHVSDHTLFISLKAAIHNYITDIYLSIEFGDAAQDIFEQSREDVDTFIRIHCPKAAEKLVAINERMQDNSPESMSSALTSCRRLLMTIADSIFPPQKEKWIDQKGKERKVGVEEYKNRLLAYIGSDIDGKSSFAIISSEVEHLASKLDAIYEKSCKGVHNDISTKEARLAVVHTYLFIAELARVSHVKKKESSENKSC